jgi:hypothetical protein
MEQQRFASLMGRARQWLSPDEFEPELQPPPPSGRREIEPRNASARSLASVGELVRYKQGRLRSSTLR